MLTPSDDVCTGITRQAILDIKDDLKSKLGVMVEERQVTIDDLISAGKENRILSVFGASTHCPLLPVSSLVHKDTTVTLDVTVG